MSTSKHKDRWETEQEETEMAEKEAHDNGICMGIPLCGWCIDDFVEQEREELDKMGYYDSKGHWVK